MQFWAIRREGEFRRYTVKVFGTVIKVFTTEAEAREGAEPGDEVMQVDHAALNKLFLETAGTVDGFIALYVNGELIPWPDFERFVRASSSA